MRIAFLIFLMFSLAFGSICGVRAEIMDISSIKTATPFMMDLDALYTKALSRERLKSYDDALFAYNVILSRAQNVLNNKDISRDAIMRILPYGIAAAYRKGIVTHRSIEGAVVKLHNQLELYDDAEKWINEILTQVSNLEIERGIEIPEEQYGMLYYARAYNRAGWAYALLNGNYWKRYLIYTPADTILMFERSIADLEEMANIYKVRKSGGLAKAIGAGVAEAEFKNQTISASEFLTFVLCYNQAKLENIKKVMGKQLDGGVNKAIKLYNSKDIQKSLQKGKEIYTYEDFMKPDTREVIRAMAQVLNEMGTY